MENYEDIGRIKLGENLMRIFFMTASMSMPSERLKVLWRELQRTRPHSKRYKELVTLIRAEAFAHLTPTDSGHIGRQAKA